MRPIRRRRQQKGIALLTVTVAIALIGATVGEFAYNARIDLEAAANSRDMLRAEYLARSAIQLGQLLIAVQGGLGRTLGSNPATAGLADSIVLTDYAGFLVQAFGGDKEAREGLGGLLGLDLGSVEGLGSGRGTSMDLEIQSEEGKVFVNCGGGLNTETPEARTRRRGLFLLINSLIRPPRYSRMFNIPDRDGVLITYEELPRAIIDWTDVDVQRYDPDGNATASEDRYDRGRDRYEAHNHFMDTVEELMLVRGVSEDFWAAFGEMFTVYGTADCRLLASAIGPESWPLVAGILAAASPDPAVVFDPNTALVAQQVAALLKTGLPVLRTLTSKLKVEPCPVSPAQCPPLGAAAPPGAPPQPRQPPAGGADSLELLSNLICSPLVAQLPQLAQGLSSLFGPSMPRPPTTPLRPIRLCPGRLAHYLAERPARGGSARRFFRLDARGSVRRNDKKSTHIHIRAVWDAEGPNNNPLCTNHPRCQRGTWMYWRMD
ncbi:MAG: type II secretion system protein GspK [Myxococcales bacterium]|nr:type II secretion system protein GspK [Myxococcota bacterium]MDW8281643.1 type II secretion system protein GspK [Myxococcales bacterium]